MKSNYYNELIVNIKFLIKQRDYSAAYQLIATELAMPYVPLLVLNELQQLAHEVKGYMQSNKTPQQSYATPEVIINHLITIKNSEEAVWQVYQLSRYNIRPLLSAIKQLLVNHDVANATKTHLVFLLKNQTINEPLTMWKRGQYQEINNLAAIPLFNDNLQVQAIIKQLDKLVANDNVNLYNLTLQILRLYYDELFPGLKGWEDTSLIATALCVAAAAAQGHPWSTAHIKAIGGDLTALQDLVSEINCVIKI